MCRPHSVTIDMEYFENLLQRYEEDVASASKLGFPQLSYRQWTMVNASRNRLEEKKIGVDRFDNDRAGGGRPAEGQAENNVCSRNNEACGCE